MSNTEEPRKFQILPKNEADDMMGKIVTAMAELKKQKEMEQLRMLEELNAANEKLNVLDRLENDLKQVTHYNTVYKTKAPGWKHSGAFCMHHSGKFPATSKELDERLTALVTACSPR